MPGQWLFQGVRQCFYRHAIYTWRTLITFNWFQCLYPVVPAHYLHHPCINSSGAMGAFFSHQLFFLPSREALRLAGRRLSGNPSERS